jgi:hypothetical protein
LAWLHGRALHTRPIEVGQSSARLISLRALFEAAALLAACQSPPTQRDTGMVIGGKNEKVNGTACRQADGSWRTSP